MNTFDEIIDSLEFIGKYAEGYGNFGLNVTFEIGLSKDNTENNPLEFPLYKVIVKRNDKNDISGYELTISFLSDGENDSEIYKKCNEIKNYEFSSSLKFDSINGCELQASLGNDLNVAATII